jgi:hypothetical protein
MSLIGTQEKYLHNTLNLTREVTEDLIVYNIPRDFTGMRIEPGSVLLSFTSSDNTNSGTILDKGDGTLILQDIYTAVGGIEIGSKVGDVIYPHGLVILLEAGDDEEFYNLLTGSENYRLTWKSNQPIFTATYLCKVSDYELNYTLNPSATKPNTEGEYIDSITGGEFRPYITSVGLYNDSNELLGVAKFSQPIPKSSDVDMTFVIKLDY